MYTHTHAHTPGLDGKKIPLSLTLQGIKLECLTLARRFMPEHTKVEHRTVPQSKFRHWPYPQILGLGGKGFYSSATCESKCTSDYRLYDSHGVISRKEKHS
jgi:hypothetical protein